MKVYPPTTHITFSCTTALWDARASDVPKGLTLGRTQKDSVDGTVREQSGPGKKTGKELRGGTEEIYIYEERSQYLILTIFAKTTDLNLKTAD